MTISNELILKIFRFKISFRLQNIDSTAHYYTTINRLPFTLQRKKCQVCFQSQFLTTISICTVGYILMGLKIFTQQFDGMQTRFFYYLAKKLICIEVFQDVSLSVDWIRF